MKTIISNLQLLAAALHRKPETVWKDGKYGFLLQETVNLFKLRQEKKKLDELFGLMYQSLVYLLSFKGLEVMESLTSRVCMAGITIYGGEVRL